MSQSFLRKFVTLNEGTEIPSIFALWCGLSGISCALGRRTWIDMGTYTLYPNTYVVLVAGSGRCRKSTAIGMIERLIYQLEPLPNLISQKITPEALVGALQHGAEDSGTLGKETCEGFVLVDELSTFLNKKTYESGLATLLIPFFDAKDIFVYETKGRGKEKITKLCLGLLGASTVEWIRSAIPEDAIGGGLTSRMIFVYVDEPPPPVAITKYDEGKQRLAEELAKDLQRIAMIPFHETSLTPKAWDYYENGYNTFAEKSPFYTEKSLSGYASRRHTHLLKLAMAFAAAEGQVKLTVDESHLAMAENLLEQSERHMPRVLNLIQASEKGALVETIYAKIRQAGFNGLSHSSLLRMMSYKLDALEVSSFIDTLNQSNRIQVRTRGSSIYYISTRLLRKEKNDD